MTNQHSRGPWTHRLLTYLVTAFLSILFYWLLGFVLSDIGNLDGPSFSGIESEMLDGSLADRTVALQNQIANVKRRIETERAKQKLLRDSTTNSQTTMNQMLELQRLNLQKDVKPSDEERQALAESQRLFLKAQGQYQTLTNEISTLSERQRSLGDELRQTETALSKAREPVNERYNELYERHRLRIASYKLMVLSPLLLIAAFLYVKKRNGTYWAIVYAFGLAVLIKSLEVMHEYFPREYFKYVLILAVLAAALRVLVYLLRLVAHPKQEWLVKQYREAYEAFLCPICSHPIRRGPLKYMSWTRRSIRRVVQPMDAATATLADEAYTCPACSTQLYGKCDKCSNVRHSLLPACEACGNVVTIVE